MKIAAHITLKLEFPILRLIIFTCTEIGILFQPLVYTIEKLFKKNPNNQSII